jgi:multisubunit Na+/H+ antiporter MnhG subunit
MSRDVPDLEAKIKYKAKTGSGGCLIALVGLVCFFYYFPIGIIVGILLILIANDWASYYACGNCSNEVKKDSKLCPSCDARLKKRGLFGF